jgi:uncharacterized RDD family membrane protein YckC
MDPSPPSWQGGQPTPPPSGYPPPGGQGGYGYPPAGEPQGYPPAPPAWPEQQPYGGEYGGQQYPGQYGGGPQLAGFWIRVGATLLDFLILLVPLVVIGLITSALATAVNGDELGRTAAAITVTTIGDLIAAAVYAAYTIILISRGQTIGMRVCGTHCVTEEAGQPPDITRSAIRWLVPVGISYILRAIPLLGLISFFLIPVVILDWLWMLWDPKNQTLHDKVAKTLVIKV